MIKPILSIFIFMLAISCSTINKPFLNKKQTHSLFEMMISDIEYFDAEMRLTRDNNKEVSWEDYQAFHKKNWNKRVTPKELKKLFLQFSHGYLNGHSHLEFLYPIEMTGKPYVEYESNVKLGYTYPDISFYNVENGNRIVSINDEPIEEIFWDFSNYKTTKIESNAVLKEFSSYFNQRYLRVSGEVPFLVSYEDQGIDSVHYITVEPSDEDIFFDGLELDGYEDWETVEKGYKVALLKKDDIALIKIKNFIYMQGFGGDINCSGPLEEISDSTMCKDVKFLMRGLESIKDKTNYLIFDLQDNLGGNENTPFVKMFCPAPFTDTRVQYRKTELIEDSLTRDALNYFNPNAENWFSSIKESGIYDKVKYGDFLPMRGDFCQADDLCGLGTIKPNNELTTKFKKIIILTNHGTGSSADDFVFRFKEFGGAYIAGQPQSADLTYSLISVVYYIDEKGGLDQVYYGNAQEKPRINGEELFKINIPYSKTIDKSGSMLQGNPVPMDLLIPISRDNFTNIKRDVLNQAIEYYCN